jgi:hypothetical protein
MFSPIPNDGVFALELSPYQDKRAVVGYRSGVVCVIDAQAGEVLFRLDGTLCDIPKIVFPLNENIYRTRARSPHCNLETGYGA